MTYYAKERHKIEECWRKTQRINPTSNDRASAKVVSNIGTIGSTKIIIIIIIIIIIPNLSCYDILWVNRI